MLNGRVRMACLSQASKLGCWPAITPIDAINAPTIDDVTPSLEATVGYLPL